MNRLGSTLLLGKAKRMTEDSLGREQEWIAAWSDLCDVAGDRADVVRILPEWRETPFAARPSHIDPAGPQDHHSYGSVNGGSADQAAPSPGNHSPRE